MSFERQHTHEHAGHQAAQHDDDLAPGRKAASSQLVASSTPITSALIQRKARDANGVAEHADRAVANAAASSGHGLPGSVMRKFETSLGTELSGVRVHTGSASAHAAAAVSAKAYTVGQDIHFAAGQYDPSSTTGQHLLAHEVAHTVQQRGGTPRRQNKLEVSAPTDSFEHEADRAADAMVRGAPFSVGSGARQLSRGYGTEFDKAADAGAQAARNAAPDRVLSANVVQDRSSAEKVSQFIEKIEPDLHKAVATGDATAADLEQNNQSKQKLDEYVGALEGEELGLRSFQGLYKRVQVDFARLDAMAQKAGSGLMDKNATQKVGASAGTSLAKDHIDFAAGQNDATGTLAARAEKLAAGDPELRAQLHALEQDKAPLKKAQMTVTTSEKAATNACNGLMAASNDINAVQAQIASADLKRQFEAAKQEVEENKERVELAIEGLLLTFECLSDPEEAAETLAKKAVEKLGPLAIGAMLHADLSTEDKATGEEAEAATDKAAVAAFDRAKDAYAQAAKAIKTSFETFVNDVAALDDAKKAHHDKLVLLGATLDKAEAKAPGAKKRKPGEVGPFELVMTFLAEADGFIADAMAAKDVGRQELTNYEGDGPAHTLHQKRMDGVPWLAIRIPTAYKEYDDGEPHERWIVSTQTIGQSTGGAGSAENSSVGANDGANSTVQDACAAIDKFIEQIQAYRTELRKALGV